MKKLEHVQLRTTKQIPELRNLNYESRLANMGLTTLDVRRETGDLIQFLKFSKGLNLVNWNCVIEST